MAPASTPSGKFPSVPVVQIDRDNGETILTPILHQVIQSADFVAIDCELSGLGDRKLLNNSCMEQRYENLCRVAQTRAIIALGISVFRRLAESATYSVETFNILVLCGQDYIVEPMALKFLVQHGFDFKRQYSKGIQYIRGDTEEPSPLRDIFACLVRSRKPLVLHNGLVDLVFLYQNMYAQLPATLQAFLADLSQMFPSGIYDTKFIADFVTRTSSSYLEFLFRKEQRTNEDRCNRSQPHVRLCFPDYEPTFLADNVEHRHCAITPLRGDVSTVCDIFADHGHCELGGDCPKSHNIDLILLKKEGKKKRKRKRKAENTNDGSTEEEEEEKVLSLNDGPQQNCGGHRAGFDAFMTGFAFSTFQLQLSREAEKSTPDEKKKDPLQSMADVANKIYLVGKSFPMLVQKSAFTKYSASHLKRYQQVVSDVK